MAVSKYFYDSGRKEFSKLCESISECEAAAKGGLNRFVCAALASQKTSATFLDASETNGANGTREASGASPSK